MRFRSLLLVRRLVVAVLIAAVSGLALPLAYAASSIDVYAFPDAATEARYRGLIEEFRCPKCLNTNLAGSDAPIAQDLRKTVHRLLVSEGFSDGEIRSYLHERYGDFVLYDPPLNSRTVWLWAAPVLFALIGLVLLARSRSRSEQARELGCGERARLKALAEPGDDSVSQ